VRAVVLIIKQPTSHALLLVPVLVILLIGPACASTLRGLALAALSALPLAWLALKEYQRERILVFLTRSAIRSERVQRDPGQDCD